MVTSVKMEDGLLVMPRYFLKLSKQENCSLWACFSSHETCRLRRDLAHLKCLQLKTSSNELAHVSNRLVSRYEKQALRQDGFSIHDIVLE